LVTLTPDETLALVLSGRKVDPANPTRQIPDNRMTVLDLTTMPPKILATLETGRTPSGVSINREGTLALVGNAADGTISIFTIAGKTVTPAGTVKIAEPAASVRHPVFTPDGKRALVTRDGDHFITVLNIEGTTVKPAGQNMRSGFKPYVIDINRDGTLAVAGNVGYLNADTDTIGVFDLKSSPPRAVDVIPVGQTPEGLRLSPDGSLCAVVMTNGSGKAPSSPLFHANGVLQLFRVEGTKLTRVAEAPLGGWPQTAVISRDNRIVLASSMTEQCVHVFRWNGKTLTDTKQPIKLKGAPAAMGMAAFGGLAR
jgi:DNA-binding beta-propeller fold protein YncE